jgi:hypothetical protein
LIIAATAAVLALACRTRAALQKGLPRLALVVERLVSKGLISELTMLVDVIPYLNGIAEFALSALR